MESIFNSFVDLAKSFNTLYKMNAIWLNMPVMTSKIKTSRIIPGDKIRVECGLIVDVTDTLPATHKVVECKGTIGDTLLMFELENLETKELSTLNVK